MDTLSPAFWHREYGQPIHTISHNHVTRFEHCSSDNRIVMCFLRTKFGASPLLFLVERMTTSTHKLFMFIIFGSLGLWVTVAFPPSHIRPVLHISHHVVHCYTLLHNATQSSPVFITSLNQIAPRGVRHAYW